MLRPSPELAPHPKVLVFGLLELTVFRERAITKAGPPGASVGSGLSIATQKIQGQFWIYVVPVPKEPKMGESKEND